MDTKSHIIIDPELVATCDALGHRDVNTGKYIKDEDCDACLRDLIRFLKTDDFASRESKEYATRRALGQANVAVNDLLPLLNDYCLENEDLFQVVIRLLVSLTTPPILLFEEKLPTDKIDKQRFLEMIEMVRSLKVAFGALDSLKCWTVLAKYMTEILSLEWEQRTDDHKELFERMLILIRNLLHVPLDSTFDRDVRGELNAQDRLISIMHKAGIVDIILLLVSSEDEVETFCFHILEISSLMLREQSAEYLAKCWNPNQLQDDQSGSFRTKRSAIEMETDDQELQLLINRERESAKKAKPFYSRFREATFEVKNLKSLTDKNFIIHKIPTNLEVTSLGLQKQNLKKGRNRVQLKDSDFDSVQPVGTSRSPPEISRMMSNFCHEFLKSYNNLMRVTDNFLARNKNAFNDETYYLWAAAFFMEFNRFSQPDIKLVAITFSVKSLHDFHTQLETYMEKLRIEKRVYSVPWSRRLHYALKAYRELIFTLAFSDSSTNVTFYDVTKAVKTAVFYEDDYRELLLTLIKTYNPIKMTRKYLVDLVLTNHVFLRLLKTYCLIHEKVTVKAKARKKSKKPRKKSKKAQERELNNLDETWDDLDTRVTCAIEGLVVLPTAEEDEDVLPLDSTVDFEPDIQKLAIIQRIQRLLKDEKASAAVALFRNAREAWPDDQEKTFGEEGCSPDDEKAALKAILMSDVGDIELKKDEDKNEDMDSDKDKAGSGEEEEKEEVSVRTSNLTFIDVFKKYCHPKVIQAYVSLLKDFEKNSSETNHAIVKMFHRMAFDLELYGMFFQASLFRIFQNLFKNKECDSLKELVQFATFIVRKFVAMLPKNDMLLIEMLFWKSAAEAVRLDSGFDDYKASNKIEDFPILRDDE